MTDARGRHKLGLSGRAVTFHGSRGLDSERQQLLKQWQRMTNKEREVWGYQFDNYANSHKEKK